MKEHYFSEMQNSKEKEHFIKKTILGNTITLETSSGVFSPKKIDKGSEVLIKYAKINQKDRVLDLGCGYGTVGISLAKAYEIELVMTEINKRAFRLAKKNALSNKLKNVTVLQGDGFKKIEGDFDVILLNPPQSAGKSLCENLIKESKQFLKKGGSLQIVARRNKGGKSLSEYMHEVFGNVDVLGKSAGYWVYISTN